MKMYFTTILLAISSFSYATNVGSLPLGTTVVAEQSMKDIFNKVIAIPPVENVNITIFANRLAGPVKKLSTNSCIKAVEFLKPSVGDTPKIIMDGGYRVYIQQNEDNFYLSSHHEMLFAWIERCEKLQ